MLRKRRHYVRSLCSTDEIEAGKGVFDDPAARQDFEVRELGAMFEELQSGATARTALTLVQFRRWAKHSLSAQSRSNRGAAVITAWFGLN